MTYLLLGCMSNTTNMTLYPEHPMFRFADGAFQPLSQVGYEAFAEVGALRTETQTAIAQTNASIALKADQTTTDALSTRIDQAEQRITPEAIASTVTSAALFAYEKYEERNYCLNSENIHTFVDNQYRNPNGVMTSNTGICLKFCWMLEKRTIIWLNLLRKPDTMRPKHVGKLDVEVFPRRIETKYEHIEIAKPVSVWLERAML